jgi:[ribosomal protein S5]-alanine N-acetyltransferase
MKSTTLLTRNLTLRPLSLSDAEALLPVFSDEETMRYWAHGPVASIAELKTRIAYNLTAEPDPPNAFAIAETAGGPALGWVSLYAFHDGNAGAGYILNKSVRGRGYAREALRALLDYAFGPRGLHRVYLDIDPENSASIGLAQSMQFRWEGHFKESFLRDGVYYDSVFYAMLAREWRALKSSA